LLVRGSASQRFIALFTIAPSLQLGLGVAFGTLEEQFLYFLLIPSVVVVAVATARFIGAQEVRSAVRDRSILIGVVLMLLVAPSVSHQIDLRTHLDDAYQNALAYIDSHRTAGEAVAWAEGQTNYTLAQYFYLDERSTAGPWAKPDDIVKHNVRYVLTTSKEIAEGYTYVSRDYVTDVIPKLAHVVFSGESRWNGTVQVWEVNPTPVN
jgi:hypothetical protein